MNETQRNVQEKAKLDAQDEASEIAPQIPSLTIVLAGDPSGAVVHLDDKELPAALVGAAMPLDPTRHVVRVERGAWHDSHATTLKPGEKARLEFDLPTPVAPMVVAAPAPTRVAQPGLRTFGWIAAGAGLVGLGVGTAAGLVAWSHKSDLDGKCPGGQCAPGNWSTLDGYNNLKLTSTIGFAAGGACLIIGAILLLMRPSEKSPTTTSVAFAVGPRSAQVLVRF